MPAPHARLPHQVLADLLRTDAAAPRITCYDDTPGSTAGERVELSARVLGNWVNKVANALQEELDVEPGTVVRLDLPPHWRTAYWALAVWQVGACVALDDGEADVVVTTDPAVAVGHDRAVLVTLAALARSAPQPPPPGVLDEAREVSTFGDAFLAVTDPDGSDPGVREGDSITPLDGVLEWASSPDSAGAPEPAAPGARVHVVCAREVASTSAYLRTALTAWAAGGSVVLSLGGDADALGAREASEGVTASVRV